MRTVRRGLSPVALMMRSTSIIAAEPAALSVAPVPPCHESKCAPMSDDLVGLVGAGNLADDVEAVRLRLLARRDVDVQLDFHRRVVIEQPDHAVVVLDRERDLRQIASAGSPVADPPD